MYLIPCHLLCKKTTFLPELVIFKSRPTLQHFKCKLIRKSKLTRHKRFAYEGCLHSRVRALNPTKIGFFPQSNDDSEM